MFRLERVLTAIAKYFRGVSIVVLEASGNILHLLAVLVTAVAITVCA